MFVFVKFRKIDEVGFSATLIRQIGIEEFFLLMFVWNSYWLRVYMFADIYRLCKINCLGDCNGTRTHNHLVCK